MAVAFQVIKNIGSILFTSRTSYQDLRVEVEQFSEVSKHIGSEYEELEQHIEEQKKWMLLREEYVKESKENYLESEQWRQEKWNNLEEKHYECIVQYQREKEQKQNYEFWEATFQIDKMIGECRNSWLKNLEILNTKISVDHNEFHLNWCKKLGTCGSIYSGIGGNGPFYLYPTSASLPLSIPPLSTQPPPPPPPPLRQ
jgi:hypothetical protein